MKLNLSSQMINTETTTSRHLKVEKVHVLKRFFQVLMISYDFNVSICPEGFCACPIVGLFILF